MYNIATPTRIQHRDGEIYVF